MARADAASAAAATSSYAPCRLVPLTDQHLRALDRLDLGPWPARQLARPGGFAVVRLGAVVGLVTLTWHGDTAEVAVAVDAVRRGRGVGTAALRLAAETARHRGGRRVTASVPLRDAAGIAVLHAAGFRLVGIERAAAPDGADRLRYDKPMDAPAAAASVALAA